MSGRELSDAECDAVVGDVFGVTTWRASAHESAIVRAGYAAGRAAMAEECAKVCEGTARMDQSTDGQSFYIATGQCAAAIRALAEAKACS